MESDTYEIECVTGEKASMKKKKITLVKRYYEIGLRCLENKN